LNYIYSALEDCVVEIIQNFGELPIIFSGGVMSNTIIKNKLKEKFTAYFAEPQYSSDNACGVAILASICDKKE
jgi:N6-L-threonylcarbamoyladenine synthase